MGWCVTNNTNQLWSIGDTIQYWTRLHQWSTSKLQTKSIKYKLIIEHGKKTYSWSYKYVGKMHKIVVGKLFCHHYAKLGAQCEPSFGLWNLIYKFTTSVRLTRQFCILIQRQNCRVSKFGDVGELRTWRSVPDSEQSLCETSGGRPVCIRVG
jgi:hypothetical protein